jgi:hypothetical protein
VFGIALGYEDLNDRQEPTRYHRIGYDAAAIEALPVTLFLEGTNGRRSRSFSTSMPRTTRSTGIRRSDEFLPPKAGAVSAAGWQRP